MALRPRSATSPLKRNLLGLRIDMCRRLHCSEVVVGAGFRFSRKGRFLAKSLDEASKLEFGVSGVTASCADLRLVWGYRFEV